MATSLRRRRLVRDIGKSPASVVLVGASLATAAASILDLGVWVAAAGALAAVVSGAQVIWSDVVVPGRLREAVAASVAVRVKDLEGYFRHSGTTFQFSPGLWATACHVVRDSAEVALRFGRDAHSSTIAHQDTAIGIALLRCATNFEPVGVLGPDSHEDGSEVRVIRPGIRGCS